MAPVPNCAYLHQLLHCAHSTARYPSINSIHRYTLCGDTPGTGLWASGCPDPCTHAHGTPAPAPRAAVHGVPVTPAHRSMLVLSYGVQTLHSKTVIQPGVAVLYVPRPHSEGGTSAAAPAVTHSKVPLHPPSTTIYISSQAHTGKCFDHVDTGLHSTQFICCRSSLAEWPSRIIDM